MSDSRQSTTVESRSRGEELSSWEDGRSVREVKERPLEELRECVVCQKPTTEVKIELKPNLQLIYPCCEECRTQMPSEATLRRMTMFRLLYPAK